jgi:hypothetical protein
MTNSLQHRITRLEKVLYYATEWYQAIVDDFSPLLDWSQTWAPKLKGFDSNACSQVNLKANNFLMMSWHESIIFTKWECKEKKWPIWKILWNTIVRFLLVASLSLSLASDSEPRLQIQAIYVTKARRSCLCSLIPFAPFAEESSKPP